MNFQDLILNKNWLKILSLVLAMLIWFVINTNFAPTDMRLPQNPLRPKVARDFRVPVMVMTSAANRQLFEITPPEVRVTVSGDPAVVGKLTPDEVQVVVRLVEVADAQGSFRLEAKAPPEINTRDLVIFPPNVQVKTYSAPPIRPGPAAPH